MDFHLHQVFFYKYYNQYEDVGLQKNQQHQELNLREEKWNLKKKKVI